MKIIIKKILFVGLIIFLLMQLYQPARNEAFEQDMTANFTEVYKVPKNVETILRSSCYDCHSNTTNYRWYDLVQPARYLVENHIVEAKKELNFDEYGLYSKRKQGNKLDRIVKQIKSGEMPLSSYTLIHRNAILTTTQKEEIINWINKTKDSLSLGN
jgi:hypothetical protein